MLLLTNDGVLAERLSSPEHAIPKTYEVFVSRWLSPAERQRLEGGILLDGSMTRPCEVEVPRGVAAPRILVTLREGRRRQIRRMLESLGVRVERLVRIRIGELGLGSLAPGEVRELGPEDLEALLALDSARPPTRPSRCGGRRRTG